LGNDDFQDWWKEACRGKEEKLFVLRFPARAWDIPWELLIDNLSRWTDRASVCIVRSPGREIPYKPSEFGEPMRTLILKGDDGAEMDRKLDLDAEVESILGAWQDLDKGARECVHEPRVEQARRDFSDLMSEYQPRVMV
jgi:hypothetical protein